MDGDGAGRLVGLDAAFEGAGRRRLEALLRADDGPVEGTRGRARDLENALQRGDHVLRGDLAAVPELHTLTELENVGLSVVSDLWQRFRQVWDDLETLLALRLLEADQPVMGDLENLPELQRIVDVRVDGAGGRARHQAHGPTAMLCHVFGRGCGCEDRQRGSCHNSGEPPFQYGHCRSSLRFVVQARSC